MNGQKTKVKLGEQEVEILKGELAVLELKPGDQPVLMFKERLSPDQIAAISETWRDLKIGGMPVLVVAGARLGVIRSEGGSPA